MSLDDAEWRDLPDGALAAHDGRFHASIGPADGALLLQLAARRPQRATVFADDPGALARRVAHLSLDIRVLDASGTEVSPSPLRRPTGEVPDRALAGRLAERGLDVVAEHGIIRAELRGLMVARSNGRDGLDVGVGEVDMEASRTLGLADPLDQLDTVVSEVARHRVAGSRHPMSRFSRARWLRHAVRSGAGAHGLGPLEPLATIEPRWSVRDEVPACAIDDAATLVACCSTLDRDTLPEVLDQIAVHEPERIAIVVTSRDRALAERLCDGLFGVATSVLDVDAPWESAGPVA